MNVSVRTVHHKPLQYLGILYGHILFPNILYGHMRTPTACREACRPP